MGSALSSRTLNLDTSFSGNWGGIVFFTVISCGSIHGLFGCIICWKLLSKGLKALLIPPIYFLLGVLYSFLSTAILAAGIAIVHLSLKAGMNDLEMILYCSMLVMTHCFFSAGRTSALYSM